MKRREFLNSSVLAGTAALMSPVGVRAMTVADKPAIPVGPPPAAPFHFSRAWFERNLRTRFRIHTEDGAVVDAELVGIKDAPPSGGFEQFSTVFRLSKAGRGIGGLRSIEHAQGRFELLLSNPHDIGDAQLCLASFSLPV